MSLAVTYYGQNALCLKSTETASGSPEEAKVFRIIVDPAFLPRDASTTLEEIPADVLQADYILQTQAAANLLADVIDLARRTEAQVICHSDLAVWFVQQGAENVAGMSLGSGATFPFGKVIMTLAHQAAAEGYGEGVADGRPPLGTPVSYLVHFNDGLDVYIAGNSAQTADMELIGKAGGVDLAILPLGDQPYNGSDAALRAAQLVQAKHVLPMQCERMISVSAGTPNEAEVFAERLRRVAEIDTTILLSGQDAFF